MASVEASELDRFQALFDEGLGYFARLVAANVELDAALDRSHAANHPSPLDDVNAALDELALALEDSRSWFQTMRFLARDTSSDALIRRLSASNGSPR